MRHLFLPAALSAGPSEENSADLPQDKLAALSGGSSSIVAHAALPSSTQWADEVGTDAHGDHWSINTAWRAPIITGMISLWGDTHGSVGAQRLYAAAPSNFLSITNGANGTCTALFFCTAQAGYSGPTGPGIPQGFGGF